MIQTAKTSEVTRVFVSVAANLDPERTIPAALEMLAQTARLMAVSTFYRTDPIARPEQPMYLNGVALIETDKTPRALKEQVLLPIEAALGRVREADKYAARPIDLDILAFGEAVLDEPGLRIPDPDLTARAFLAAGILELAPEFVVPGTARRLPAKWVGTRAWPCGKLLASRPC